MEAIDAAARGMGFRMGPFELVDTIGADVNLAVSQSVYEAFGRDPRYEPQEMQEILVSAGRLGRKTSGGFYDYAPDGSRGNPWSGLPTGSAAPGAGLSDAQIAERLLATIVNEAASAVADGVAAPESIDVAMRLGANYPYGPLEWGERVGLATAVRTLDALAVGSPDGRYRVVPLLRSLAEGGGSFFAQRP
jgi:3-hydroxybutyryl-CoA dehydrogenase